MEHTLQFENLKLGTFAANITQLISIINMYFYLINIQNIYRHVLVYFNTE